MTVSFWSLAYGATVGVVGTPTAPGADASVIGAQAIGLALILMPAAFASAAFITGRPDAPIAVLAGMGLALGIGLPLLVFRNPLASLIVAYAAGAIVTVSYPPGATWHNRAIAAAGLAVFVVGGMEVVFVLTVILAPGLPFLVIGLADLFEPRRRSPTPDPEHSLR